MPRPRLCHLHLRPDFQGFGFNLHAEKKRVGQFIGKIDAGSPAEESGLREGDRIIEINEEDISNENHQQVVQRIKSEPGHVRLLVVDAVADTYYDNKNIRVHGGLNEIIVIGDKSEMQQSKLIFMSNTVMTNPST